MFDVKVAKACGPRNVDLLCEHQRMWRKPKICKLMLINDLNAKLAFYVMNHLVFRAGAAAAFVLRPWKRSFNCAGVTLRFEVGLRFAVEQV